ncbi:MAG: hypothetical protein Q9183_006691 [Haloplaca sp. 2 TL-2023]
MSTSLLVSSIVNTGSYDDDQPIEAIDRDPYARAASLADLIALLAGQFSTRSQILMNFLGMLATIRWQGRGLLMGTITSVVLQVVEERRMLRLEREKEAAKEKGEEEKEVEKQTEEV